MLRARISALLVFDADNALVGVLSEGDLIRRAELGAERKRPRWIESLLSGGRLAESYAHSHGRKIGEIMTRKVVSVGEDADLSDAVDLMLHPRVKRLPVLRGEAVVGRHLALRPAQGPGRGAARRPRAAIPTPRSRRRSRPNSTGSAGRRGRACGSRSQTAPSPSSGAITDERLRDGPQGHRREHARA